MVAILENYQDAEGGSVRVPAALQPLYERSGHRIETR